MAISDVLADALAEIKEEPALGDPALQAELVTVMRAMRRLQLKLDRSPKLPALTDAEFESDAGLDELLDWTEPAKPDVLKMSTPDNSLKDT